MKNRDGKYARIPLRRQRRGGAAGGMLAQHKNVKWGDSVREGGGSSSERKHNIEVRLTQRVERA